MATKAENQQLTETQSKMQQLVDNGDIQAIVKSLSERDSSENPPYGEGYYLNAWIINEMVGSDKISAALALDIVKQWQPPAQLLPIARLLVRVAQK